MLTASGFLRSRPEIKKVGVGTFVSTRSSPAAQKFLAVQIALLPFSRH
jgi:hypothetical protein